MSRVLQEYYAYQEQNPTPPPYMTLWQEAWIKGHAAALPLTEGYYTRRGASRYYKCTLICAYKGKQVLITSKGHLHLVCPNEFEFTQTLPPGAVDACQQKRGGKPHAK